MDRQGFGPELGPKNATSRTSQTGRDIGADIRLLKRVHSLATFAATRPSDRPHTVKLARRLLTACNFQRVSSLRSWWLLTSAMTTALLVPTMQTTRKDRSFLAAVAIIWNALRGNTASVLSLVSKNFLRHSLNS